MPNLLDAARRVVESSYERSNDGHLELRTPPDKTAVDDLEAALEAYDEGPNSAVAEALCALKEAADYIEAETGSKLGAGRLHRLADEAADEVGLEISRSEYPEPVEE